jgi:hypothetical protein
VTTRGLSTLFLIAAMVAGLIFACSTAPPDDGVYVQASWQEARMVKGHRVHVLERHVSCSSCHELKNGAMGPVSPVKCAACHEKQAAIQHASGDARARFGPDAMADCASCHAFGAPDESTSPTSPKSTDGGAVAHTPRQLPERDFLAIDAGATPSYEPSECLRCHSVARGDVPPVVAHGQGDACLKCHRPHEQSRPERPACFKCHEQAKFSHAAHGGEAGCKGCHTHQHAKADEALGSCLGCHSKHKPIIPKTALFEGGHAQCESCHAPHSFEKALAKPCKSCHESVHVIGGASVAAHQQCTSCHSPHDVKGSPVAACAKCHSGVNPRHPRPSSGKGTALCIDCHSPHAAVPPTARATAKAPANVHDTAKPCSQCHSAAKSDHDFHRGSDCTSCHRPHAFKLTAGDPAACQQCHLAKLTLTAQNKGHQACAGCHKGLPHAPATGGGCETCHAAEQGKANPGHRQCMNCHEPHAGKVSKECKSCHAVEGRTAPPGHQKCQSCHEQHSGAPEHAACASCHAEKAKTKHGQIDPKCSSCHVPHGPKAVTPPACSTCHETKKLPGLHAEGKHTVACSTCHGGHDTVGQAFRAPCLSCHTDRKEHFPEAPSCATCHVFRTATRK